MREINKLQIVDVHIESQGLGLSGKFISLTRNKGYNIIYIFFLSLTMSFSIVSCGGCKGANVATQVEGNTVDSTVNVESQGQATSPVIQYPIKGGIFTTMNDSTQIVDGVQFVQSEYGRKITFPNGKVISSDNFPIMRDLPKKYNINPGEYYGFYDLSKISDSKKVSLLSNMDGYDPNKLKNYTEAMFTFQQYIIYDDEYNKTKLERVFIVTDLVIFEEVRRSEDDIRQFAIGRIGYMEVYDKQGNLLHEVSLDKFGCDEVCVTPDKKHVIINSNGPDGNDEITMYNNGAITIFNYDNFKFIDYIYHHKKYYTRSSGCYENHIALKALVNDSELILRMNILIDNRIVTTYLYPYKENSYDRITNDGSFRFSDGTIIKEGAAGFNKYTIDEWNTIQSRIYNNPNDSKFEIEK